LGHVLHGSKQAQKPYLGQKRRELCMEIDGLMLFLPVYGCLGKQGGFVQFLTDKHRLHEQIQNPSLDFGIRTTQKHPEYRK
jgi:hypothetical protein